MKQHRYLIESGTFEVAEQMLNRRLEVTSFELSWVIPNGVSLTCVLLDPQEALHLSQRMFCERVGRYITHWLRGNEI